MDAIERAIEAATAAARADRAGAIDRWIELLEIPSIGADPAHDADTRRAAELLAERLRALGMEARLIETSGQPMVLGRSEGPEGAPHLLYYGHYDVQPADPLELWDHPPFEPRIVEGPLGERMVARGAVDDKGQLSTFMEAFRAWRSANGALPIGVTVLFEGEEESGSSSMQAFLREHGAELEAAAAIVSDTGMPHPDQPAIVTSLRGLAYAEIRLRGPARDLHSGHFGGAVTNPVNLLAQILAEMIGADGKAAIPGFYDAVRPFPAEEIESWRARIAVDEKAFLAEAGLSVPAGEPGLDHFEKTWARPSLDVNGIWGGYAGEGAKTVIASEAGAKLSCRLVPDQDPAAVFEAIASFVRARVPADCRVEVIDLGGGDPIRIEPEGPWVQAAARAASRVFGRDPVFMGCGGSIPVVGWMKSILGLDSVLLGFGLADDRIHSPNEKFELQCFERGIATHIALLGELARAARG